MRIGALRLFFFAFNFRCLISPTHWVIGLLECDPHISAAEKIFLVFCDCSNQTVWLKSKCIGNAANDFQAGVSNASFNLACIGAVYTRLVSQFLLRHTKNNPPRLDEPCKIHLGFIEI